MADEIRFDNTFIDKIVTHRVGNNTIEETLELSDAYSTFDESTEEYLITYFLGLFNTEEAHQFTHPFEVAQNDVLSVVSNIFRDPEQLIQASSDLARLLHKSSDHPNIKDGNFNVVLFKDILVNDELVDAIGLFKSERDVPFIKMSGESAHTEINHDFGFEIKGVDKGCLILDLDRETGYRTFVIDQLSRIDARYWVDDFLSVEPIGNDYNNTRSVLKFTKEFVKNESKERMDKPESADILNRTMDYFNANESFDKESFEHDVLQTNNLIKAYNDFETRYNSNVTQDSFEISDTAVKKEARYYKSVLKLDKNFHVYIHGGGKDKIEKGVDNDGRKYYKIYYEVEK